MAGRRPRKTRDEQAGTSPFGAPGEEDGLPPGVIHGTRSERSIRGRATAYERAYLADPHCPGHVRTPAFAPERAAWARREVIVSMYLDFCEDLLATEGPEALFRLTPGIMRAPIEILSSLEEGAARARTRMGINPSGYVRLAAALNLSHNATIANLQQMDAEGARTVERRMELPAGEGGPA
jgi:hypothetical protein